MHITVSRSKGYEKEEGKYCADPGEHDRNRAKRSWSWMRERRGMVRVLVKHISFIAPQAEQNKQAVVASNGHTICVGRGRLTPPLFS